MTLRLVSDPSPDELQAAFDLRFRVFVDEQKVPREIELDELDPVATHVVLLDDAVGRAVATGRLVLVEDGVVAKMQRIAVDRDRRRDGLGRRVMERLEDLARARGARIARLASQVSAIPFYERCGYFAWGGLFLDAGIHHRWMDKQL